MSAMVAIWQTLKTKLHEDKDGAMNEDLAEKLRHNPEFLDFWIFVWCSVRRTSLLQETLDLTKEVGLSPTLKTYTAMMHGWKLTKDIAKIDSLWKVLEQSGIKLDTFIWTERISAYIESSKPQRGIEALSEMMKLWKAAVARKSTETAVKPSIEVINAAIKGLVGQEKKAAYDVLAWAASEGIEPDVFTYNILIRASLRHDGTDGVSHLLQVMAKQGIQPNGATFTIMLEEFLSKMHDASAAEQVGAIHHVLEDIAASGLQPNLETWGKMLNAVASLPDGGADEAIQVVQDRMRSSGQSITVHMVTILIERSLRRNPSDTEAMEALLEEHKFHGVSTGDQALWERVMTGYAVAGHTEAAMRIFNNLRAAGRPVTSLPCLQGLLNALLDANMGHEAGRMVSTVLEYKMGTQRDDSIGEGYWKHAFWFLAQEKGLLQGLELPPDLKRIVGSRGDGLV